MTKKKGKRKLNKEVVSEDWCFRCKEGGDLLICDYGDCLKTYHAVCIQGDKSFIESGSRFTCDWHFCFLCKKQSKFCCVSCPKAVCQRCYEISEFQTVKGKKRICNHCLKLARLGEENKDVDSDGEKVDFSDLKTYEGLFLDYWRKAIKQQEGLSLEHLQSADAQLRKRNCMSESDPEKTDILEEETDSTSDYDDDDDMEKQMVKRNRVSKKKRYKEHKFVKKMKLKSSKREFIEWGSKSLILFLRSIGEDTSKKLSQFEVSAIVDRYIRENKLLDKKKRVICDEKLKSLLRKSCFRRNRIYDMLGPHLLENQLLSEEVDLGYSSENHDLLVPCKKQKKMSTCKKSVEKEVTTDFSRTSLAAIVPENIKLVYLKRSLVEELLKRPDEFEKKVIGSLVRVKSDPYDYLQQNSHQLVQVRGIKKTSVADNKTEIHLEVSNMLKDIHIRSLSEDNFTEEECEDLRKRVKDGLVGNPTVEELEEKARSLHEDITKHWIIKELDLLQHKMDQANEKGWRKEMSEYLERRELLQTPSEQSRLLQDFPKVVASLAEREPSIGVTSVVEEKLQCWVTSETEQSPESESNPRIEETPKVLPPQLIGAATIKKGIQEVELVVEEEQYRPSVPEVDQNYSVQRSMQQDLSRKENCQTSTIDRQIKSPITVETEQRPEKDFKARIGGNQEVSPLQFIELSSDDDVVGAATGKDEKVEQNCNYSAQMSMPQDLSRKKRLQTTPEGRWQIQSHATSQTELRAEKVMEPRNLRNPKKTPSLHHLIELSSSDDDDEDGVSKSVATVKQQIKEEQPLVMVKTETKEEEDEKVWYCVGPEGDEKGPLTMSVLRRWAKLSSYALRYKVWEGGRRNKESAIPLSDALSRR